jgi:hypothetical protein
MKYLQPSHTGSWLQQLVYFMVRCFNNTLRGIAMSLVFVVALSACSNPTTKEDEVKPQPEIIQTPAGFATLQTFSGDEITEALFGHFKRQPLETLRKQFGSYFDLVINKNGNFIPGKIPTVVIYKAKSTFDDSPIFIDQALQFIRKDDPSFLLGFEAYAATEIKSQYGDRWIAEVSIPGVGFVGQIWTPSQQTNSYFMSSDVKKYISSITVKLYDAPQKISQIAYSSQFKSNSISSDDKFVDLLWTPYETTASWLFESNDGGLKLFKIRSGYTAKLLPSIKHEVIDGQAIIDKPWLTLKIGNSFYKAGE